MTNQFVFKPKCHVKASNPKKNWFDTSFGLKPSNSLKYIGLTVPPTYLQWMHNVLMRDGVCGDAMTPPRSLRPMYPNVRKRIGTCF